jgi:hypothetical protein
MSESNIVPLSRQLNEPQKQLDLLRQEGGGGSGSGDDMRIARLEGQVVGIEKRLDDIKGDLSRIADKALTKWDVAQVVFYVVGAIMAAIVIGPRLAPLLTP